MHKSTDSYTIVSLINNMKKEFQTHNTRYVIVEGETDVKLFSQRFNPTQMKFKQVAGKKRVESIFNDYKDEDFILCCVVDLDTDYIEEKIRQHDKWLYNCYPLSTYHYNDIEVYLINTNSLNRLLSEYLSPDIITDEFIINLRKQLENCSRIYDSFFHAYTQLQYGITSGKSFKDFMKSTDTYYFKIYDDVLSKSWINLDIFKEQIFSNLTLSEYDFNKLIHKAESLISNWPYPWALSRGHTVTEMLAAYLRTQTKQNNINAKIIEKELRLAVDNKDLEMLPIAKIVQW